MARARLGDIEHPCSEAFGHQRSNEILDRAHPSNKVFESSPSRLDRGGSSGRRDRDGRIDGLIADWWDAIILLDSTLRVDASQRIDGFVADRAPFALRVCDRRVIVPGVHWGPGSTSSAKMHPCSTLHKASPPGMKDGSIKEPSSGLLGCAVATSDRDQ